MKNLKNSKNESLQQEFHILIDQLKQLDRNELIEVYKIYNEKLIHIDDLTWKLASIFIPLSLSGVVIGLKELLNTILIGLFSIILIWLWFLLAYRNSRYFVIYYHITRTIESVLIKQEDKKPTKGFLKTTGKQQIKRIRRRNLIKFICFAITFAWIMAIVFSILTPKIN